MRRSEGFAFTCMLMFFLLQCNFFSAQKKYEADNDQLASIFVSNGATIYSSDKNFNQQIKSKKIAFKKSSKHADVKNFLVENKQVGNEKISTQLSVSERLDNNLYHRTDASHVISLNEATIYSEDNNFNRQIKSEKVIFKKTLNQDFASDFFEERYQVGNEKDFGLIDVSDKEKLNETSKRANQAQLISLISVAKIFSANQDLNQQIDDHAISFSSAMYSKSDSDDEILIITSSAIFKGKLSNNKVQVGNRTASRSVISHIPDEQKGDNPKIKKEDFENHFKESLPSGHFSSTLKRNSDYINYRTDRKDFSKTCFFENLNLVKKTLSHLYTHNFTHYNNKSLDYCFSVVFSVRPPPGLSLQSFC